MYKETIWVTGASGRLGSALVEKLQENTDYKEMATSSETDITDLQAVEQYMSLYQPAIVINCAGIADSEYCNTHKVEAFKVNAIGARNLAIASRRMNSKIIHMSSDDVFDTAGTNLLSELDTPHPASIYGQSKLAGENYVREMNLKHVIIRSSWLYGDDLNSFLGKVIDCGKNGTPLEAPKDIISTPTSIDELCKFIIDIMGKPEYGVFHASSAGACSRYEYAKTALEMAGLSDAALNGVYANANGVVKTTNLENLMVQITSSYKIPDWKLGLQNQIDKFTKEGII